MFKLENSYSKLPERFFQRVSPKNFSDPKLIKFNYELARELGMEVDELSLHELAFLCSGQKLFDGSEPIAMAYAAHQFGHFVPELGDGRAHLLGELKGRDIQLKGSGQTQFSRNGDGLSSLGPVIREYIVSEAMFNLGVPTTRALAAVSTGEKVLREYAEPGGIFTRVAPSHIRVGTFQYFQVRQDIEALEILLDYSINRHYPKILKSKDTSVRALEFLASVCEAQSSLIAKWMSLGFIHGVMNTDNFSIGGFSLDFGPCAFMDEFKNNKVFSSIDRNGRYAYSNQTEIGQWNILRLAETLIPLIDNNQDVAIKKMQKTLEPLLANFDRKKWEHLSMKLGIKNFKQSDIPLIKMFLDFLEIESLDFTMSFRNLPNLYIGESDFFPNTPALDQFLFEWKKRVDDISKLNLINPLYIARNHQVENAIQAALTGDYKIFNEMNEVLTKPFTENSKLNQYSLPPKPEQRVHKTFCGT